MEKASRYNDPFPTNLRLLMEEQKLTQQAVADALGIKRQSVAQYCDGSATPTLQRLCSLADFFSVTTDFLLGQTSCKTPDIDVQAIIKKTRLSEESIEALLNGTATKNFIAEFLNEIIPNYLTLKANSGHIWYYYEELYDAKAKTRNTPENYPIRSTDGLDKGEVVLSPKDAVQFYAHKVAQALEEILMEVKPNAQKEERQQ